MVVLAVALLNTSGKTLLARQFVDMTRIRIEGLLAAFPKLLGSNKEHTFVETDDVRYVYHPLENMYLLCVTNKGSNIIEDLATLQLLSKVVPDICGRLDDDAVLEASFQLIFAFDEVITGGGYKVGLSMRDLQANLAMDSHEEQLQKMILESKIQDAHENMILQSNIIKQQKRDGLPLGGKYSGMGSSSVGSGSGMGMGSSSGGMEGYSYDMSAGSTGGDSGGDRTGSGGGDHSLSSYGSSTQSSSSASSMYASSFEAPKKGMSLGGTSKNNNFLKAMAVEDNLQYQKQGAAGGDAQAIAAQPIAAQPVSRGPVGDVEISCVETIRVLATRDSDVEKVEVKGAMTLTAHAERANLATIKFTRRDLPKLALQPNPILDRKALQQNVIRPRAPTKPFPVGTPSGIMKWRFSTTEKEKMPISINVWPEAGSKSTTVSIEYNLENLDMVLHNITITIPLGSSSKPDVLHCDGVHTHHAKSDSILWRHDLINEDNASGQLEFVIPGTDEDVFFPSIVEFSTNYTYADFKFEAAVDAEKAALKVVSDSSMQIAEYTVS